MAGVCTHEVVHEYAQLLSENIKLCRDGRPLLHRLV